MNNDNIVIAFTGSRVGLSDEQRVSICDILNQYDTVTVLHGDCVGADTEFHKICVGFKNTVQITINVYPPIKNVMRGFNAGDNMMCPMDYIARNRAMVDAATTLIACPKYKNVEEYRSGTWATVRYARKMGVEIHLL